MNLHTAICTMFTISTLHDLAHGGATQKYVECAHFSTYDTMRRAIVNCAHCACCWSVAQLAQRPPLLSAPWQVAALPQPGLYPRLPYCIPGFPGTMYTLEYTGNLSITWYTLGYLHIPDVPRYVLMYHDTAFHIPVYPFHTPAHIPLQ